ncbi:MAG: tyrosine-type recombinase/integrase [Clostridia bacterium]|nr:tyrosine-type recombinase/integrase [Clostridia bacterium]MBR1585624.1 tyrosine-type recombinase/integrase [Clostridia bacterium]
MGRDLISNATTRLCEAGTNIKLMQDILGHQDISATMNIYADATKELREKVITDGKFSM